MLLSQNLIPCSLTLCSFNPYLLFKFFNFLIILVCLLFIHASIHNNLSAGAQNVTGAYVIMLVYRRLFTMRLHGKAAV